MKKYFVAFLVVYLIALLFTMNLNYVLWDEASYLTSSLQYSGITDNYNENHFRPPLIPLLLGAIFTVSGNFVLVGKLFVIFTSIGALIFFFLITKDLFDEKTALVSSVLLGIFPLYFFYSKIIFADIPAFFFSLISIYFFLKKKPIHSGIFLSISFMAKYHIGLITGIIFVIAHLFDKTKFSGKKLNLKHIDIIKLAVVALLVLSPWLIYNQITLGSFAAPMIDKLSIFSGEVPISAFYYFENIFEFMPIPYIFFIFGLYFLLKNRNYKNNFLLLWFFVFFIFINLLSWKELRFFIYTVPAMSIILAFSIFKLKERYKLLSVAVLIICIASGLFYCFNFSQYGYNPGYGNERFTYETTVTVSHFVKENTNTDEIVSTNSLWPVIAYYTNREVVVVNSFEDIGSSSYLIYYNMNLHFSDLDSLKERYELVDQYSEHGREIYLFRIKSF